MIEELKIRHVMPSEMPQIVSIEQDCFGVDAWSRDEFSALRVQNTVHLYAGLLRSYGYESIVAFCMFELLGSEIHLLNIAVTPSYQRNGIGRAMMAKVKMLLCHDCPTLSIEVSERNLPAQLFFQNMGMRATSIMQEHFANGDDGYLFESSPGQACKPN